MCGPPRWHTASAGLMHNLHLMMVISDPAGDDCWVRMHVYKTYSEYCIYKITNIPVLEYPSLLWSVHFNNNVTCLHELSFLNSIVQDCLTSNISLEGNQFTIYIFRSPFSWPEDAFSQNPVKSAINALRTYTSVSKCVTWLSRSCRPPSGVAEQNLSFESLALKLQLVWQSPNLQKLL